MVVVAVVVLVTADVEVFIIIIMVRMRMIGNNNNILGGIKYDSYVGWYWSLLLLYPMYVKTG
jgi:hypothetical protein